jgi:hypothetical protein
MHINQYYHLAERQEISAKTLLLKAGEIAKYTYFLEKAVSGSGLTATGKTLRLMFYSMAKVFLPSKVSEQVIPAPSI